MHFTLFFHRVTCFLSKNKNNHACSRARKPVDPGFEYLTGSHITVRTGPTLACKTRCTPGQKVRNGTFREAPLEDSLPQGTLSSRGPSPPEDPLLQRTFSSRGPSPPEDPLLQRTFSRLAAIHLAPQGTLSPRGPSPPGGLLSPIGDSPCLA